MAISKSAKEIWSLIHMELVLQMKLNPKTDDISYDVLMKGDNKYQLRARSFLNVDGYLEDWITRFAAPDTEKLLQSALHDGIYMASRTYPIWKILFAETMIFDVDEEPIELEPFQKDILLNPADKQAWCLSRRIGKSFMCHLDATAYAVCKPPTYSIITLQSWDTAMEGLLEIGEWFERNQLLKKFAKGYRKDDVTNKIFKNGSRISCRTSTNPEKMRSKNPDRVYEDEKAYYGKGTDELSTMRGGHSLKRQSKQAHIVMSSPNGVDNEFEDLLDNNSYYSIEIPCCKKIIWDDELLQKEGRYNPTEFKNVVSPRLSQEYLKNQFDLLGKTKFMQDFMLERIIYEGQAIPPWLIDMFFDRRLPSKLESSKPCIISFDLGTTENHISTIGVGEIQIPSGDLHIIYLYEFPKHTPFWTGVVDGMRYEGVFDTVLNWCKRYNVVKIIGDATSMGSKQDMLEFTQKAEQRDVPPSGIIAYQWSTRSEKYMGKAPLYQSLVQPTIEKGKVKSIYNHQLEHEMRSWTGKKTQAGNIVYTPMRASDRDDLWTMVMQLIYAHFYTGAIGQPVPSISTKKSIFSDRDRNYKPRTSSVTRVKNRRENYRRRH